jgi:hypothetical protein
VQGRGLVGEGRMNGVDEGERIWLMGLVFTWNRMMKPLTTVLSGVGRVLRGAI